MPSGFLNGASRGRTAEEAAGHGCSNEIAEQTGGRQFPVENVNELPDIAAKIGIELRNQYIIGYSPKNRERDGKYRRVQVKLVQPRGLPPLRAFLEWAIMRLLNKNSDRRFFGLRPLRALGRRLNRWIVRISRGLEHHHPRRYAPGHSASDRH